MNNSAFQCGDHIKVKSNGIIGYVESFTTLWKNGIVEQVTYEIRWLTSYPGPHKYDFNDYAEAAKLWEKYESSKPLWREKEQVVTGDTCEHEWVEYQGFSQAYKYCKKCDRKQS